MAKEDISVTTFREYLKINTMQPDPNYEPAVEFLSKLAKDVGLECNVVRVMPNRPIVIMTWLGRDQSLKTLLLNSHMDVVPVFPEHWTYDPFSGHKDEKGDIYGRGAQDMKCVGIQYVEAIRRLKQNGKQFLRTIHITFVPEEEIGGHTGMKLFVKMEEFKRLNIAFALDEGLASENDVYKIFYAERVKWWLEAKCIGNPGHGSKFIENTAAEKMKKVVDKFLAYRDEQKQLLENNPNLTLGDVTTVNLTLVNGGVQVNVVPAEITLGFDIRVPPTVDYEKQMKVFASWVEDAGAKAEWPDYFLIKAMTAIDDSNPWWKAFSGTLKSLGLKYKTEIFIGATDARFLRDLGYPALGFSPMANTPVLLHDHDERLNEKVYLKGVTIYESLISNLASLDI